jgi:hypothetical protein
MMSVWLVISSLIRTPVQVTFVIYMAALMSFVGWFLFSIYVGIGVCSP